MRRRCLTLAAAGLATLVAVACGPKSAPKPDVEGLIAKLRSPDRDIRGPAGAALRDAGEIAVPALAALLSDPDPVLREHVTTLLWGMGPRAQGAVPALAAALENDTEASVRTGAAMALETIGPAAVDALPALIKAVRDRDPAVRIRAVKTLGQLGPQARSAESVLTYVLRDPALREAAEDSLRRIKGLE